ncbi:hypothetical protein EV182_004526 [Spiromyces aspiralis]|uniref:Uncharacterized protein n=1 Tax=Spiromyces aspiralis TaxID=68401 RepID=A0ACC1HDL2_9FUNG|nr:hypothetical protein EV182_004526 [Spiromyces aspiralis]
MPAKRAHTESDHEFDFEARPLTTTTANPAPPTTKAMVPTPKEARDTTENLWQTVSKPKSFADVIKAHPPTPSHLLHMDHNKPAPLCIVYLYSAHNSQRLTNVPVVLNNQIFHWGTHNGQFIHNVIITESTPMDDGTKIKVQLTKLRKVKAFSKHINKSGKWSGKWGCTLAMSEPLPNKLPKLHIRHRGPALHLIHADQAICCHHCLCYGECNMIDQCPCIQMMAEYEVELAAAAAVKAAAKKAT